MDGDDYLVAHLLGDGLDVHVVGDGQREPHAALGGGLVDLVFEALHQVFGAPVALSLACHERTRACVHPQAELTRRGDVPARRLGVGAPALGRLEQQAQRGYVLGERVVHLLGHHLVGDGGPPAHCLCPVAVRLERGRERRRHDARDHDVVVGYGVGLLGAHDEGPDGAGGRRPDRAGEAPRRSRDSVEPVQQVPVVGAVGGVGVRLPLDGLVAEHRLVGERVVQRYRPGPLDADVSLFGPSRDDKDRVAVLEGHDGRHAAEELHDGLAPVPDREGQVEGVGHGGLLGEQPREAVEGRRPYRCRGEGWKSCRHAVLPGNGQAAGFPTWYSAEGRGHNSPCRV